MKNNCTFSLLPLRGKILERIHYISRFSFLNQNDLLSPAQFGFKPGDSCINKLLSITRETHHSMYKGYEIRDVFIDTSKAFREVWHGNLVFKLRQNYGVSGNLLHFLDFLRNRKQRVVLNGQTCTWKNIAKKN